MTAFWGFEHVDGRRCRFDDSTQAWTVEDDDSSCPRSHFIQDDIGHPFGTPSEVDDFYARAVRAALSELRAINAQLRRDQHRRSQRLRSRLNTARERNSKSFDDRDAWHEGVAIDMDNRWDQ